MEDAYTKISIISLTDYISAPGHSKCGYCKPKTVDMDMVSEALSENSDEFDEEEEDLEKSKYTSRSYYLNAIQLTPNDYQDLINRGWRRSGRNTLYLPDNELTCCPLHTIRLPIEKLKCSKSQKKKLKKWAKSIDEYCIFTHNEEATSIHLPCVTSEDQMIFSTTFKIITTPAIYEEESYQLFRKYQTSIHKDPPSKWSKFSYKNFLVDTPLLYTSHTRAKGTEKTLFTSHYGTFHQKYYYKNQLIAVGVIDILPMCISSVYFFYDPEMSHWSLGIISAFLEIGLAQKLFQQLLGLKYYYMGYYTHSCQKLKYKGEFIPSELLDRASLTWVPLTVCSEWLNKNGHRFNNNKSAMSSIPNIVQVLEGITLLLQVQNTPRYIKLKDLQMTKTLIDYLINYIALIGPELAKKMIIR